MNRVTAISGRRTGFTLVEMMVAVSLTGLLVASALGVFIQQRRALKSSKIISETRQNVRTAVDMLSRDIRLSGYGLNINSADLPNWIDWAVDLEGNPVTMDANPKIVDDENGTVDAIWIAAAFEDPVASLIADAAVDSTIIQLASGQGAQFDIGLNKKLIFIGRVETARIVSITGDTLTISTHPTLSRGLDWDHPAGSVVELVKVRSYEWTAQSENYPGKPYLTRDDSIPGIITYYWQRLIAAGIADLQISQTGDRIDIDVTGKAAVQDGNFFNGENGSKYRTMEMSSSVVLRNDT